MSVSIRLKRLGTLKKPSYRIVVIESKKSRDSRSIEEIGHYNPAKKPSVIEVKKERAAYWLRCGAVPSGTVKTIFSKAGVKV